MKFRRSKSDKVEPAEPADVSEQATEQTRGQATGQPDEVAAVSDSARSDGPWDVTEVSVDEDDPGKVNLGGLIVTGKPGVELRLQVDEASQQVAAVLLLGPEGALELRPFAAPRNEDIWDGIRKQIAAETTRRGGTATEDDGVYGKELQMVMPVTNPDGKQATQRSRVLGISGPRWLLRATFLGKPALEPDPEGVIESSLREVIVVRGTDPMAPGDPLPLVMPASARPMPEE